MDKGLLKISVLAAFKYLYIALASLQLVATPSQQSSSLSSSTTNKGEKKRNQHLLRARMAIKKLKKYSEISPDNCVNKYFLVEAELAALNGEKYESIVEKYNRSIDTAAGEGFVHEQALACERVSYFMRSRGNDHEATKYFEKAIVLYRDWGANGKISHMRR